MKTFKQFLNEGNDKLPPQNLVKKFSNMIGEIRDIAAYDYSKYNKIYDNISNGKFNPSYFDKIDEYVKEVDKLIKEYPYGTSYSLSEFQNIKTEYEQAKDNFIIDAKMFDVVKIGEKEDIAVKKLAKATENKEIQKRFDPMSEKEIYDEIQKFGGLVKFRGGADLYVKFENGKVKEKYF